MDPSHPDPSQVEEIISGQTVELTAEAVRAVWQRNQLDPELANKVIALDSTQTDEAAIAQAIHQTPIYEEELQSNIRWLARQRAIDQLSRQHAELYLAEQAKSNGINPPNWYRNHTSLAQTTARREAIAAHNLQGLLMDPRYAYSNGALKETSEGRLRPTGARKRYHLIYGPSRVNLGAGERDSVEVWPQWVGVTDPLAAAHALAFYQLINFNPEVRTIMEAENLKVSENQWTAMVRAVRNAEAYFVGRLGVGDIEDLAHQFNRRNGLPGAWLKDGESYAAGPTTGYCIPKDLLFKMFVATALDGRKMTQIGVPRHLQAGVFKMMSEILAAQANFDTVTDWEAWAAQTMLSESSLRERFGAADGGKLNQLFSQYVSVTGGVTAFHLTKMLQILQMVGVPSPTLVPGKNLHDALWAQWADLKLTLAAEQVNRSLIFPMTREIPDGVAEARRLNPGVNIAAPEQASIHMFGTYKGDDVEAPPPDVRFSWTMRAFMILSGYGKEVALSLDEDGQLLARLSWDGFLPDSTDEEDIKVARFVAQKFAGKDQFGAEDFALVEKLKQDFPHHTTVGNITITVVPGVSAEDLLGFNAETKLLLGDRAAAVRELLISKGINTGQITANAVLRHEFPAEWIPLLDLDAKEQTALKEAVAGGIHPLVLQQRGPGTDFEQDLQAQDVAVFSVTHPGIVTMDPSKLRDLMQLGRPNGLQSALVAHDMVAQGRHRVWFDRDVMLWYAAARGIDAEGNPIQNWSDRDQQGRKAVYKAFGYGEDTYRPLLGTDLRQETARQERRAAELFELVRRVADSDLTTQVTAITALQQQLDELRTQLRTEAELAIKYEQAMLSFRRNKPRDQIIRGSLVALASGKPVEQFDFVDWLAVGGIYLLNGAPQARQDEVRSVFDRAGQKMASGLEENPNVALLIRPRLEPTSLSRAERKGEMFSVKATETFAEKAVARRKGLALQAARQSALQAREEGFRSIEPVNSVDGILPALNEARAALNGMTEQVANRSGNAAQIHRQSGQVMGTAVAVLNRLNQELTPGPDREEVAKKIQALSKGRELDEKAWSSFGGTYEDAGVLARFFEQAGPNRRELVAAAMELLYLTMLIDKTAEFAALPSDDVDARQLWRALSVYYAETLDDHFYEYNPWAFDPKRGSAFVDYYDDVGVLKPEHREELYGLSWAHHRAAYSYIRALVRAKTDYGKLPKEEYNALLGDVTLGATPDQDQLAVQAIGAGAPGPNELFWRAYGQYREIAVMQNDGFGVPVVFDQFDPNTPEVIDAQHRLNFAFVSPVGRTHYSRALMSAAQMGSNIFITRNAVVTEVAGSNGKVATISDAQFWLTEAQYREALIRFRGMAPSDADAQIAQDRAAGRITPLGIRVAARFTQPVVISAGVYLHHHSIEPEWIAAGYPATDKSPVVYEISYDKALYPKIYNPAADTGVNLPPEIDWMQTDTDDRPETDVKQDIAKMLRPFAETHGIIVAKGSSESGARNFRRFDFFNDNGFNEQVLSEAVDFIYEVSKGQNVTIQRAIIVTPIAWMDPSGVNDFVSRQIRDHGVPANIHRYPKDWVYSTQRIIMSAGMPKNLNDLDNPANWEASHPISLSSLQVATNVGRQGTLELLSPDLIRPEFRDQFIQGLQDAGRRSMAAMAKYARQYWHEVYLPAYRAAHDGADPPEFDATGVPYWWPRYLMLDFLAEPVFYRNGVEAVGARVVDVIPGDAARNVSARFVLQDADGNRFDGEIRGFKYWLLEPNVGIGLWPNLWKREELHERARAKADGNRPMDWNQVGVSDRVVLGNYLAAGEAFMKAKFGGDHYGPGGPRRDPPPMGPTSADISPPATAVTFVQPLVTDVTSLQRVEELKLDQDLSHPLAPVIEIQQEPASAEQLRALLPHAQTFAVVTGKRTLMNHHVYPFEVGKGTAAVNVIGVNDEWLTADGKATRLMVYNPETGRYLEFPLEQPVAINSAFIVELPQSREVERHQELTQLLASNGVRVVNQAGEAQRHMDDKAWLRHERIPEVLVPTAMVVEKSSSTGEATLGIIARGSPAGIIIQPRSGTTEGEGVAWFSAADTDGQLAHLRNLLKTGDAMVSAFRGNVTVGGRPLVLRFNSISDQVISASAVVGQPDSRVASLGQGGENIPLAEALTQLTGPDNASVAITAADWQQIQQSAQNVADVLRTPVAGIDMVLETTPDGHIRGVLIEANARPGTLILGETVQFPASDAVEDASIESSPAAPVGPAFWTALGISQTTTRPTPSSITTLSQWIDLLRSGRTDWMTPHYTGDFEAHRVILDEWISQALKREVPGTSGTPLFDPNRPIAITRTPGRFLFPVTGRHLDYLGGQGGSIGSPTQQETVLIAQEVEGLNGQIEIYQIVAPDPSVAEVYPNNGLGARTIDLNSPFVNPDRPIRTLADWDTWAKTVTDQRRVARAPDTKVNYADDLAAAIIAFARTELGDPSGKIRAYLDRIASEGKGFRFALASNLPTGGGLSSSSAVAIGFAQTLAQLAGVQLTHDQLVNFGYAERFYAGTQGGLKDHAHLTGDTGYLGVAPTRTIATMSPIPGASVLLLDSGVSRDRAIALSPKLGSKGNDEQNIKGRTATGYALVNLLLRHIHPELTARIAPDTQNPDGYLRNLVPGNPGGMSVQEVYKLLGEIPAEGLTRKQMYELMPEFKSDLDRLFAKGEEPPEPYALREMALFFFAEESRNWEVVRVLNALKADEINSDQAFERLIEVGRAAHNGDRVTRYEITPGDQGSLNVNAIGWDWHLSDPTLDQYIANSDSNEAALWRQAGRLERSIEPLDRLVDLVEYYNQQHGGNSDVAVVMGAGLGGTVGVLARSDSVDGLTQFLNEHYYQPLGLTHGPVIRAQAGKGASVLVSPTAGLEESATKVAVPSASRTVFNGLGVVAGPTTTGLQWGLAIARNGKQRDGRPVPVVFLVNNDEQRAQLTKAGFGDFIFTNESEAIAAITGYGVKPVLVGVGQSVPESVFVLFAELFGIELSNVQADFWQGAYASAAVDVNA